MMIWTCYFLQCCQTRFICEWTPCLGCDAGQPNLHSPSILIINFSLIFLVVLLEHFCDIILFLAVFPQHIFIMFIFFLVVLLEHFNAIFLFFGCVSSTHLYHVYIFFGIINKRSPAIDNAYSPLSRVFRAHHASIFFSPLLSIIFFQHQLVQTIPNVRPSPSWSL